MSPNRRVGRLLLSLFLVAGTVWFVPAEAAEPAANFDQAKHAEVVSRAVEYLRQAQAPDGSYSAQVGPAVTALVTSGLLRSGLSPDDPLVAKSLNYLQKFVHEDGGIYAEGSTHQNYETSLAILAFSEANKNGRYDALLKNAERFVKGLQWDQEEGVNKSDFAYGGAGYGSKKRPDLSNTSFLLDALQATGNGPEDEAVQRALIFVSRCQNLETEYNTTPHAAKVNDGGFYYTAAAGGSSQAGETDNGGLRSYASMTYAGLKSMIYAGVDQDDPRVKAAVEWIKKHYGLENNPGMGTAGLYYYYNTFAKALDALGQDVIVDAQGKEHHWRQDLLNELARRQQKNGSWINEENERWLEGDANLVTGYALLSLSHLKP